MFFNFIGSTIGDYVVDSVVGQDKSRHKIYLCKCPKCGNTITGTRYDLVHRKNIVCDHKNVDMYTTPVNAPVVTSGYVAFEDDDYNNTVDTATVTISTNDASDTVKYSDDRRRLVSIVRVQEDIFNMPFCYDIACCCATRVPPIGLSEEIIFVKGLEYDLENYQRSANIGDVACFKNVYVMFPTTSKHEKTTIKNLSECLENLADFCARTHTKYLAMPFVGCGRGGLNKDEVFELAKTIFNKVYDEAEPNISGYFFNEEEELDEINIVMVEN